MLVEGKRRALHDAADFFGRNEGTLVSDFREQDAELFSTDAGEEIFSTEFGFHLLCELLEEKVTRDVTVAVVFLF